MCSLKCNIFFWGPACFSLAYFNCQACSGSFFMVAIQLALSEMFCHLLSQLPRGYSIKYWFPCFCYHVQFWPLLFYFRIFVKISLSHKSSYANSVNCKGDPVFPVLQEGSGWLRQRWQCCSLWFLLFWVVLFLFCIWEVALFYFIATSGINIYIFIFVQVK